MKLIIPAPTLDKKDRRTEQETRKAFILLANQLQRMWDKDDKLVGPLADISGTAGEVALFGPDGRIISDPGLKYASGKQTITKEGAVAALSTLLELINSGNAASMAGTETALDFLQRYYSATPSDVVAARISAGTEGNWTGTASTQDAFLRILVALNGVLTEAARISSGGVLMVNETTPAFSSTKLDIQGLAAFVQLAAIGAVGIGRINGTRASPSKILSGEEVGQVEFDGQYDTTVGHLVQGAKIVATAEADYAGSANAKTKLELCTNNGSAIACRVSVSNGGFTALGADASAPAIKMKKLTGTTGATEGSRASVAHGLTGAKIISMTALVSYAANSWVAPAYTASAEYQFDLSSDATNVNIDLAATNSGNIKSKSFVVTIFYEE